MKGKHNVLDLDVSMRRRRGIGLSWGLDGEAGIEVRGLLVIQREERLVRS
jgi:hypothetical protein